MLFLSSQTFWRDYKKRNRFFLYHILMILVFTVIYYYAAKEYGTQRDKNAYRTWEDCLYYTSLTHFTVGLGDIAPQSHFLRNITIAQVLGAFTLMNI